MKKFKLLILIALIFTTLSSHVYAWVYSNNVTGYPYANSIKDQVDQWNTYTRNCTSYAMWKINQSGLPFNNNPTGPNGRSITMSHAKYWDENASYIGYTVDNIPTVGNPVNWESNSGGAGDYGHVAWVEQVHTNNSVFISEWNWNWGDGNYNERDYIYGDHYLHLTNGCSSVIKNKTVNSGVTFNCSQPSGGIITVSPETTFISGSNVRLFIN